MSAPSKEGPPSRKPGDRIAGKLELVRPLGEGGMGAVWVARNLTTCAEVAIKVLHPHREGDGHAEERFRHEARLGAMLAHRNIPRVFDLLEDDDGSLVLVMELLHGDTLEATYKARGAVSSDEAVAIIVPILGALQHAHDHGVVHRDLKPANIFLHVDPDGHTTPKLLDFGIAKTYDASALTRTGDALGSPSYMSPEQVRASSPLDARSDLFSIGVVLYEIITGENPFSATSPTAALAQVLEAEIDPDPRISPRLWLEIQRALSKQAYERHASASALADALCRAVGHTPLESLRGEPMASPPEAPAGKAISAAPGAPGANDTVETFHTLDMRDALGSLRPGAAGASEGPPEAEGALAAGNAHEPEARPPQPARSRRPVLALAAAAAVVVIVVGGLLATRSAAIDPDGRLPVTVGPAAASGVPSASGESGASGEPGEPGEPDEPDEPTAAASASGSPSAATTSEEMFEIPGDVPDAPEAHGVAARLSGGGRRLAPPHTRHKPRGTPRATPRTTSTSSAKPAPSVARSPGF